ncbi:MAG TPA: Gfo/Idh/MocA family oxidoreductase [Armatimonadota bacterium]|jgi:predicted dehydrogenase
MTTSELKIGIVGAAGRGQAFFDSVNSNENARLAVLCDTNEEGLKKQAEELGITETYTDYEDMLNRAGLDAVIIGTPMHLHAQQSIMALESNVHVMSEVTAAVTMQEAKELVAACRKSKYTYMMAENCCYMKPLVLVREIARAGLFGDMYYAEGEYLHELKERNELTPWRRKWQSGINGNTYCTHSLGPIGQWMDQRVVSVACIGSGHHYTDPRGDVYENEDTTLMLCRTEKGGLLKLRLDMLSNRPYCLYYSLQGTTGSYEAPRSPDEQARIWLKAKSDEIKWFPLSDFEDEFLPEEWKNLPQAAKEAGHDGSDYFVLRDFVETVTGNSRPSIGIDEAMDMTLPGLISQESIAAGGGWLPVPNSRHW